MPEKKPQLSIYIGNIHKAIGVCFIITQHWIGKVVEWDKLLTL